MVTLPKLMILAVKMTGFLFIALSTRFDFHFILCLYIKGLWCMENNVDRNPFMIDYTFIVCVRGDSR